MELKVSKQQLLNFFKETEPDAVAARKSWKFRQKRFWAAGVIDIWAIDQHDRWQRFGLWMHCSIDPYPGWVAWLKIWWCNRNTHLINGYYISAGRKVGGGDCGKENNGVANMHTSLCHHLDPSLNIKPGAFWSQLWHQWTPSFENILDEGLNNGWYDPNDPIEKLVFGLAIPWLQAELDLWTSHYNSSPCCANKHKILPHGIPDLMDLIHAKPHQFNGSKNFMVVISPELFDEVEKEWAPPDDPVFQLVPPNFGEQALALYASIGSPLVSSLTFWAVYSDLLDAFLALPHDPGFAAALLMADQGEEHDVPIMAGLWELQHSDNVVGPYGYVYMGGLDNPVLPAGFVDGGLPSEIFAARSTCTRKRSGDKE
ncbi:hypothetical protein B0H34DRAFT_779969 [Crassisporium funariophilum]|nr:hypothetical protein B0H34DRAFT_779969 [Crassisporium funariophilum]